MHKADDVMIYAQTLNPELPIDKWEAYLIGRKYWQGSELKENSVFVFVFNIKPFPIIYNVLHHFYVA